MGLTQALTPLFLEREFGLGTTQRGLLLAVGAAMSSVTSLLSGRLGSRMPPSRVIAAGLALEVAGFVALGLAPGLWMVGSGGGAGRQRLGLADPGAHAFLHLGGESARTGGCSSARG